MTIRTSREPHLLAYRPTACRHQTSRSVPPRRGSALAGAAASLMRGLGVVGVAVGIALGLGSPVLAAPRDSLTLLIPDGASPSAWPIQVWTDTAAEEGLRMELLTDSALLALGADAARQISGLIVPDSAHIRASDAVVQALTQYANLGGKLMLVYDAGALNELGFYPPGKSRLSALAGVDYVLYDTLGDRTVGFGPVVGTAARLNQIGLPPGKYQPYAPLAAAAATRAIGASAQFVPSGRSDPGGTQLMRPLLEARARAVIDEASANVRQHRERALKALMGITVERLGHERPGDKVGTATRALDRLAYDKVGSSGQSVSAVLKDGRALEVGEDRGEDRDNNGQGPSGPASLTSSRTAAAAGAAQQAAADTTLSAISGYGYNALGYFSYVTQGPYQGTVHLSSPDHGVVAGSRNVGSGQVLFVNLPLGYFKAIGSDSAPLHGFLSHFAREQVGLVTQSTQPGGVGGLVFNWHVDDGDDLLADTRYLLDATQVLERGPFSIHFTAGVDVVTEGDGRGMMLDSNPASQDLVRRLGNIGAWRGQLPVQHELGSHGGWNHDLFGNNVSETNQATYQPWLDLNFAAIERTTGRKVREYSAPNGNNPTWVVQYLEARGVVGMYYVGDGGAGVVRSWRDGSRLTDRLWSFPVAPAGRFATFEEFEVNGITDAQSGQWLLDLQSFVVNQRTSRLFYNHPPGARGHLPALMPMLLRADALKGRDRFNWYTMTRLADFNQRRVATQWNSRSSAGLRTFTAHNPVSLEEQTWLLPRSRYQQPNVLEGKAAVRSDANHWLVVARAGTQLIFTARER